MPAEAFSSWSASPPSGAQAWPYQSDIRDALGHAFSVEAGDDTTGDRVARLVAAFAGGHAERAVTCYSVADRGERTHGQRFALCADGDHLLTAPSFSRVMAAVFSHLNYRVVGTAVGYALLHAAAAESDGMAVLLSGASGAGKTTLVAGLLQRGLRYFTDDIAALSLSDLTVQPYPRPLHVKRKSWAVLQSLEPTGPQEPDDHPLNPWLVCPAVFGEGVVAQPCPPGLAVMPIFDAGVGAELEQLRGPSALTALAECCFNPYADGVFQALGRLVRTAPCYRLRFGDLEAACDRVMALMESQ